MLPDKPHKTECGILNLGDVYSQGTHWTCYVKDGHKKLYFDSFGDVCPPLELLQYLGGDGLVYNNIRIQDFTDPPICGHLCLELLRLQDSGVDWKAIIRILNDDKFGWCSWFSHKQTQP